MELPSRRSVLKGTSAAIVGAAIVGAALAPNLVRAAESTKKLRVGIVGGRFGLSFQFHEHPDCIVPAVSDLRPEPLRHNSGHEGSQTFITHEFVDACRRQRKPAVDVHEALAYTAPGIVAHESALKNGERLSIPGFD